MQTQWAHFNEKGLLGSSFFVRVTCIYFFPFHGGPERPLIEVASLGLPRCPEKFFALRTCALIWSSTCGEGLHLLFPSVAVDFTFQIPLHTVSGFECGVQWSFEGRSFPDA